MSSAATALVIVPWIDLERAQQFADSVAEQLPAMSRPVVTAGEGASWIDTRSGNVGERVTLHGWRVVEHDGDQVTLERTRK